jgi:histidinol-phosphate aminotransferase
MQDPMSPAETRDVVSFIKRGVRLLEPYSLTTEAYPIKLNQNESPYDLPDDLKREIVDRISRADWSRYPPFYAFGLAQLLAAHNGVPESSVLVGSGSNELTLSFMTAVLRARDEVVFSVPTFPLYSAATHVLEGKIVPVPLRREDFSPDVSALIERAQRPRVRMVFICTPNNPTGGIWTEAQIRAVLDATDCLVVIDEAYYEFAGAHFAHLIRTEPRVVLLRTFSKAMAMAGLRMGYLLGNADLLYEVSKVRLPYNINIFSQETALAALQRMDLVKTRIRQIKAERERVRAALLEIDGIEVFPSYANFLLVRVQSATHVFQELLKRGILVRDVSRHPMLANCLRVTIGRSEENDAFLSATADIIAAGRPA